MISKEVWKKNGRLLWSVSRAGETLYVNAGTARGENEWNDDLPVFGWVVRIPGLTDKMIEPLADLLSIMHNEQGHLHDSRNGEVLDPTRRINETTTPETAS